MEFYKETEFRETDIGRIPKDWPVKKLGEIVEIKNGQRPIISDEGSIPVYGANGIMGYASDSITEDDFIILIGRVGASGEVNVAKGKIWVSDNAFYTEGFREGEANPRFLYYLLKNKRLSQFAKKSTHPIISLSFLRSFPIEIPKIKEQEKIASFLSDLDELIQQTDSIIQKTQELKKGLMQELLTKGIGHKEFKYSEELGHEIPKEWEVVSLGSVCEQRKESIIPRGEGSPFIGLEHIESEQVLLGKYSQDYELRSLKFKFYPDDVLYGKLRPYLDKAVLTNSEGICSTDILVLTANKEILSPGFLVYLLHSKSFISHAVSSTTGTNHPRTSWKAISQFLFGKPPVSEQNELSSILFDIEEQIEKEKKAKKKMDIMKKGLMQILLTGQVRIKVN